MKFWLLYALCAALVGTAMLVGGWISLGLVPWIVVTGCAAGREFVNGD